MRQGDEVLYLSKGTLHMLRGAYELLGELKGAEMVGWTYDGPFDELEAAQRPGGFTDLAQLIRDVKLNAVQAHQVIAWEAVGEEEGTGIVHIAPGCGAEDFLLGKEHGFPLIAPLDEEGVFLPGFDWLSGMHVSEVAAPIFEDLEQKGVLYQVAKYTHRYPVCWRCDTELVFRLVDEWFISMGAAVRQAARSRHRRGKARSLRYQIMDVARQIKWIPEFGYAARDGLAAQHARLDDQQETLLGAGAAHLGVHRLRSFRGDRRRHELQERAASGLDVLAGHTPHRPYIDAVKIACPQCGAHDEPHPRRGQSLAGCRHRPLQHAQLPQRPRVLAQVVPRRLDQRILPRAVPQLVLQPAGHGNRDGRHAALPGELRLRHAAG